MASAQRDIALHVEGLTKRYGDLVAVDGLSLEVRRGEILGFLGPNGAGKTTTLKMLCGLLRPDAGRIELDGSIGVSPQVGQGSFIGFCLLLKRHLG